MFGLFKKNIITVETKTKLLSESVKDSFSWADVGEISDGFMLSVDTTSCYQGTKGIWTIWKSEGNHDQVIFFFVIIDAQDNIPRAIKTLYYLKESDVFNLFENIKKFPIDKEFTQKAIQVSINYAGFNNYTHPPPYVLIAMTDKD
jgi:hypothetical protein